MNSYFLCSYKSSIVKILVIIFCFVSCQENKTISEIKGIVTEWMSKTIKFPADAQCCILGNDTLPAECKDLFNHDFKILLYVDSAGCSSCRLRLEQWKPLIEESDSLFQDKLGFLLFFQPKNKKEMSYIFKMNDFDYPVFIDINNSIDRLNHFPEKMEYQCFLLDKNNKVLMIGNPALNPKIWQLYKKQIDGKSETDANQLLTYIKPNKTIYD
jgi:hypothetical protein